eukprot:gene8755-18107_t
MLNGVDIFEIVYKSKPIGIRLSYNREKKVPVVFGFESIAASVHGRVRIGDEIISVNETLLENMKFKEASYIMWKLSAPICMRIRRPRAISSFIDPIENLSAQPNTDIKSLPTEMNRITVSKDQCIINQATEIDTALYKLNRRTHANKSATETLGIDRIQTLKLCLSQVTSDLALTLARLDKIENQMERLEILHGNTQQQISSNIAIDNLVIVSESPTEPINVSRIPSSFETEDSI